jgi:hypothetical protein
MENNASELDCATISWDTFKSTGISQSMLVAVLQGMWPKAMMMRAAHKEMARGSGINVCHQAVVGIHILNLTYSATPSRRMAT